MHASFGKGLWGGSEFKEKTSTSYSTDLAWSDRSYLALSLLQDDTAYGGASSYLPVNTRVRAPAVQQRQIVEIQLVRMLQRRR
jgi:hypothetical protein